MRAPPPLARTAARHVGRWWWLIILACSVLSAILFLTATVYNANHRTAERHTDDQAVRQPASTIKTAPPRLVATPVYAVAGRTQGSWKVQRDTEADLLRQQEEQEVQARQPTLQIYRHYFNKVYVFSPTWELDDKTTRCRIPPGQIFEDSSTYEEVLTEIVEGQMEDIKEDGKRNADHILLIFSDLAGTKLYSNAKGILNKIAFNHRAAPEDQLDTGQPESTADQPRLPQQPQWDYAVRGYLQPTRDQENHRGVSGEIHGQGSESHTAVRLP